MYQANNHPQSFLHHHTTLSSKFSLLLWNIHKENQGQSFKETLYRLTQTYKSDLLLFQEVKYPKKSPFSLQEYSFALAGNIETQQNIFGVLTATKSAFREMHRSLSTKKELGFMSHKSFLLSRHTLANNKELTILNLHAINFVSSKTFAYELENIEKILLEIDGPLIVAGDFNTWSKKRHKLLENFQLELGLKKLQINDEKHIKQIFWQRLDHIYYRELKPLQALALDTKNISDHNPIYAEFELL